MNTKLLGSFGFASMSIALLSYQLMLPAAKQLTSVQVAAAGDNILAFSSIVPMPMAQKLPVANIVDIAAESVLQRKNSSESTKPELENEEEKSSAKAKDAEVAARGQIQRTRAVINVNGFVADQVVSNVSTHVLATNPASHNFAPRLQSEGFSRPHWQDMSYGADFKAKATSSKPFLVMLDPGHGGSDSGTIGHNGLREKDLTLDIARRVRLFLTEHKHIDVQLTRNYDYGLSRQSRVNAVKRSEADMVISLHFNHLPQSEINLVESYYAGPKNIRESLAEQRAQGSAQFQRTASDHDTSQDLSFTSRSARLAHNLQQRVFNEVGLDNKHVQSAGVKEETLFVLTRSFKPGVLLEISCLSQAPEADKLTSEEYRNRLAAALVDGIRYYHDHLRDEPLASAGDVGA